MTKLSPAAQAVFDAYANAPCRKPRETWLAAALRAAVAHTQVHHGNDVWECDANELLAIATELEAQ